MGNLQYTRLGGSDATFQEMIQHFGVVTVMDADIYVAEPEQYEEKQADEVIQYLHGKAIAHIDTLKIANVTVEGPTKTVSGGQYSNPLIKFGKSARLEMQDALGRADVIDLLCGGIAEVSSLSSGAIDYTNVYALHVGEDFNQAVTIIGDSFFLDQKTGKQVPVKIVFYQFLPDSIFNLTQDAEGDATVFDINGDLLTTNILVSDIDGDQNTHGVFYSIIDYAEQE